MWNLLIINHILTACPCCDCGSCSCFYPFLLLFHLPLHDARQGDRTWYLILSSQQVEIFTCTFNTSTANSTFFHLELCSQISPCILDAQLPPIILPSVQSVDGVFGVMPKKKVLRNIEISVNCLEILSSALQWLSISAFNTHLLKYLTKPKPLLSLVR